MYLSAVFTKDALRINWEASVLSKGPLKKKLESKKVNVDSTDLQGTADGTSLRNTKHFLQA